ncbi:MAG: hypothetical protein AMQ74_00750 [Candidatus Methanofastidiosum methylothiophilum]|uniref:Uncharacterized protein n=1 Tax=Candidatus Methanofastidiosum methylothiophilum TaxID=1705564 RepID=A0A150J567_9EURY|nr:MAG: hypothetical protein AMQ74_00750 [Candidatus Methanofastidiosum methylthiophilus]
MKILTKKKIMLAPWLAQIEDGPILDSFNSVKAEKEVFEVYKPVKLGNHLYYSALYYLKKLTKQELSKLVIVDEKGNILKDKEKAYKVSLALNIFTRSIPSENIKFIMRNIEEIDDVKRFKSKADYYIPTAKLFLSKKDAETLEKSFSDFYQHEHKARVLLANFVDGLKSIGQCDYIDYKFLTDIFDDYIKAGFERVKSKESIMKYIELMKDVKKSFRHREDEFLDTEAGSYYMLDRIEVYIRKEIKYLELKYEPIRQYLSRNIAEDEVKILMDYFNKNI